MNKPEPVLFGTFKYYRDLAERVKLREDGAVQQGREILAEVATHMIEDECIEGAIRFLAAVASIMERFTNEPENKP